MKLPPRPTPPLSPPPPQDQMIVMSMTMVCLRSLPLVLVYFLHITLFSLKIKNKPLKNRIDHQTTSYALEKYIIKISSNYCNCQETIDKDEAATVDEEPIGDGLLITTVATATAGIFFSLRAMGLVQHDALLMSTSLAWLMSL